LIINKGINNPEKIKEILKKKNFSDPYMNRLSSDNQKYNLNESNIIDSPSETHYFSKKNSEQFNKLKYNIEFHSSNQTKCDDYIITNPNKLFFGLKKDIEKKSKIN